MQKPEDFIFPVKPFDKDLELKYKDCIIQIPTRRKTQYNKEETIPCLFKKNPHSKKYSFFFIVTVVTCSIHFLVFLKYYKILISIFYFQNTQGILYIMFQNHLKNAWIIL